VILAPSVLAADFGHLADQVAAAERGGGSVIHVDVMDGHFVPNLTLGPAIVKAIRRATKCPIDVHLMIEAADQYTDAFVDAGATWVSVHVEALVHLQRTVAHLKALDVRAGVAMNPATPLSCLDEILPEIDYVLLMTVNPGFGGQTFLPGSIDKVRRLRDIIERRGLSAQIEVDGGISHHNAAEVVAAGADILVAGSAVFGVGDAEAGARALIAAAQ